MTSCWKHPGPCQGGTVPPVFPVLTQKPLRCPKEGTAFPGTSSFRACPIAVRQEDPLGCAVTEGLRLGAGEGPQPLGSSCFQRQRVLIGRPASPRLPSHDNPSWGECQASKQEIAGDKKEKRTALVSLGRNKGKAKI